MTRRIRARRRCDGRRRGGSGRQQRRRRGDRIGADRSNCEPQPGQPARGQRGTARERKANRPGIAVHAPRIPAPAARTTEQSRAYGARVEIIGSGQ